MATKSTTLWTLPQLRTHVGITDAADETQDALLTQVGDGVSEFIEKWTRRKFVTRTKTEVRSGTGLRTLYLLDFPVVSFTSLTILRSPTDATPETVSTDYYVVDLVTGKVWLHSDRLTTGVANVTAVYSTGYGTQGSTNIPQDIFFMGLELVNLVYTEKSQGAITASAIQIGAHSIQINPSWPKQIKSTLDNWRRRY